MDETLTSRYECKYIIRPSLQPVIREYLQAFMQPDSHASPQAGFRYQICSLYMDSRDLKLYQTTVKGIKNRFKLRVRTYSDKPENPVFFEVKKRMDGVVRKCRAKLDRAQAHHLLSGAPPTMPLHRGKNADDLGEFNKLCMLTNAVPIVRIRYTREAYVSPGKAPLRITFDTELMHAITCNGKLSHNGCGWFPTPTDGVILEIKFTERCPRWVQEMIRTFQLHKQSVAKYILSMDRASQLGTYLPEQSEVGG